MGTVELAQDAFLARRLHRGNTWVNDSANHYEEAKLHTHEGNRIYVDEEHLQRCSWLYRFFFRPE